MEQGAALALIVSCTAKIRIIPVCAKRLGGFSRGRVREIPPARRVCARPAAKAHARHVRAGAWNACKPARFRTADANALVLPVFFALCGIFSPRAGNYTSARQKTPHAGAEKA